MYRGHLVGGLASYFLLITLFSISQGFFAHNFLGCIAALAGSLFPDIDIYSKGQRLFLKVLLLLFLLCLFFRASIPVVILALFSSLPILFPHRGLFHDIFFVATLSVLAAGGLIYMLPHHTEQIVITALFFFVGVLSHLILDKGFKKTFTTNTRRKST